MTSLLQRMCSCEATTTLVRRRLHQAASLCLGVSLGFSGWAYAQSTSPYFSIPADESPHNSTIEWWYYTGHLTGKDIFGVTHDYGFQVTDFRLGVGTYPLSSGYIGNFAITDLNRGVHENDARVSIQPDVLPPGGGYNIQIDDWNANARSGSGSMAAGMYTLDYLAQLSVQPKNYGVVWNGNGGIMPPTTTGALNYYSFPSLSASGTIVDHGLVVNVTGSAWFDHEWGAAFSSTTPTGWDWYAVELSDGRKYDVSVLKDASGNTTQTYGTYIAADGSYSVIDPSEIDDQSTGVTWTSPRSGLVYHTQQILKLPGGQVTVTALVQDQEMATFAGLTGGVVQTLASSVGVPNTYYWEGDSTVSGVVNGVPVTGKAYLELNPPQILP